MNPTLAGLLQGCAESALDATAHLILADWLEDNSQPERAELIRVQCRLADWIADVDERRACFARAETLIARHRADWLGPLEPLLEYVEFVRGLARVWVPSRTFGSNNFGAVFMAQRPMALVEQVRILRCKNLSRVATRPWLDGAPALSLAQLELPEGGLDPLWGSDHTTGLIALNLSGNTLSPGDVEQMRRTPLFDQLAQLELRNAHLPDLAVATLQRSASERLKNLDLIGNTCSPQTLAELVAQPNPGRVMNSIGMEFCPVPAGTFLMGSVRDERGALADQHPQHAVTLTQTHWMGRCAVTQAQYQVIMNDNPSRYITSGAHLPAENIDYPSAQAFCDRLAQLPAEVAAGRSYRLPTEAEWEHACRAGSFGTYSWGEHHNAQLMNYRGRFDSNETEQAHPGRPVAVGSYLPNAFGLHEMHGNIWEWTSDWYGDEWYSVSPGVDPVGPTESDSDEGTRTIRGGCWHAVGICCRSAHRFGEELDTQDDYTGFRIVMVPAGSR